VLAHYFAEKYSSFSHSKAPRLHQDFLDRLQLHTWPGNVRELGNFMRRVLTLSESCEIDAACFEREFQGTAMPLAGASQQGSAPTVVAGTPFRQVERLHLENTLALTDGNRTHAAEMLGISLRTLRNKIREYGLPPRSYA
jgi:DNA-binding NtrC family response regulator